MSQTIAKDLIRAARRAKQKLSLGNAARDHVRRTGQDRARKHQLHYRCEKMNVGTKSTKGRGPDSERFYWSCETVEAETAAG